MMPVGFSPMIILTIIGIIAPLIMKWCEMRNQPEKARKKAAKLLEKGKTVPGPKVRRRLKKEGMPKEEDQNKFYHGLVVHTAATKEKTLIAAAKGIKWDELE
jgi:hypothetical protein